MKKYTNQLLHQFFIFVILLAVNGCAQLPAKNNTSSPYKELNSINKFPDKLCDLNKGKITNYEEKTPGGGFSVKYSNPCCVVDIYIFDAQIDHIPNNINDGIVVNMFKNTMFYTIDFYSKDEYENLTYSNGRLIEIDNCEMWFMEMEYTTKDIEKRYSVLGMTVFEGKYFKFRITTLKDELNNHKARVNCIIRAIVDEVLN